MADGLFDRLPPTFTAYFIGQIQKWPALFPAERSYFERLFRVLNNLRGAELSRLFGALREIERRMGVTAANWNPREFGLRHVDFLNRSPYREAWRQEIRRIFGQIDPVLDAETHRTSRRKIVIVLSPPETPVGTDRMWLRIRDKGRVLNLQGDDGGDLIGRLLAGSAGEEQERSLLQLAPPDSGDQDFSAWAIEAGTALARFAGSRAVHLSYERLLPYRRRLMEGIDQLLAAGNVGGPRELAARLQGMRIETGDGRIDGSLVLADFLRTVMLAGNGTLLVNNSFVQWATAQAARRARPAITVIAFGVRNKIKPFSSLLIYKDQDESTIIPSQEDTLGTYVDLEVFFEYVWLGFEKYLEYRGKTAYLYLDPYFEQVLAIAPDGFLHGVQEEPLGHDALYRRCADWLAGSPARGSE